MKYDAKKARKTNKYDALVKQNYQLASEVTELRKHVTELAGHVEGGARMHGINAAISRALILVSMDHNELTVDKMNEYLAEADILVGKSAPLSVRIPKEEIDQYIEDRQKDAEQAAQERAKEEAQIRETLERAKAELGDEPSDT